MAGGKNSRCRVPQAYPAREAGKERKLSGERPPPNPACGSSLPTLLLATAGPEGGRQGTPGLRPTSWVSRRVKKGFRYLASSHRKPLRSCRLM